MDKAWTIVGNEFLPDEGKAFKTTKELYEIKFSEQLLWHTFIKNWMILINVLMHPEDKTYGEAFYRYILVYVYGIMCISNNTMITMKYIETPLGFNNDKIESTYFYLGSKLEHKSLKGKKYVDREI